jgi:hypothetical protein
MAMTTSNSTREKPDRRARKREGNTFASSKEDRSSEIESRSASFDPLLAKRKPAN